MLRLAALATAITAVLPGCPPNGDGGRYRDEVFDDVDVTGPIAYADVIGLDGRPVTLHLDVYAPAGDTETERPAIVWIHGGGFRVGSRTAIADLAAGYARRGYVGVAIDYRLDPDNSCQIYQDGEGGDPVRCARAIAAAQEDAETAVDWVRAHADELGVDPSRVAAGGSSAGAVTAANLAFRTDGRGPNGGPIVEAAVALSGCEYDQRSITHGDAPIAMAHAEGDPAVPFACAEATVAEAVEQGIDARLLAYRGESLHARHLYDEHKEEIDELFCDLLVDSLDL